MSPQASDKSLNFSSPGKYQQSLNIPNLTEVYPIGKTWEKHRNNADKVSEYYAKGGEDAFNEYAWRLRTCSDWLEFRLVPEQSADILNFKLESRVITSMINNKITSK